MEIYVGTLSTWSIRALICLKLANIKYQVHLIDLNSPNKAFYLKKNPYTGLVPFLIDEDIFVYDSLSIFEYVQELKGCLLPLSIKDKAIARSLCAEMHSGFFNLRKSCPYTLEKKDTINISEELDIEIQRINQIFESAQKPFMFNQPSAVDAFYSVLAFRLLSYGIKLSDKATIYQNHLLNWHIFKEAQEEINQL
ncbi:glutathione S-transferase [Acinetobacter apis]|uniref:Glutathione S-transferase n=1 Tax=Acinetobacter apis TaxID=1229165 RepID=A0A217ECE2_9GAMM|nr:glutathione S-transferase family protein [Acinetobacter apis]SNQ28143.1 glutathione S-transferase [Acinetobacter apis]